MLFGGFTIWRDYRIHRPKPEFFDGNRAYQDVAAQVAFGPRTPGSEAHEKTIEYIRDTLEEEKWLVEIHAERYKGQMIQNVIARRSDIPPQIIIGAHYDSRLFAEQDPDLMKQMEPVLGANDGASGVAVLLELGRVLPESTVPVWLVFFDAEDQGGIPGWEEYSIGSKLFVQKYAVKPRAVIIVDMVGDENLRLLQEKQSSPRLNDEIWELAANMGFSVYFVPESRYTIEDDHVPFLNVGIPAIDIIDIEYQYWHTSYDTLDKISIQSLTIVGSVLQEWVTQQKR